MLYRRLIASAALLILATQSQSASLTTYPTTTFYLYGVVFDDGGQATGQFQFNFESPMMPLPQFYNIQISTSAGSTLGGSNFASAKVCYNNHKKFVCAPNDDFVINLEVGTPGQPGYDRFQIAAFFAPQAINLAQLDTTESYETGCTANGCFTRRIVAGAIR